MQQQSFLELLLASHIAHIVTGSDTALFMSHSGMFRPMLSFYSSK